MESLYNVDTVRKIQAESEKRRGMLIELMNKELEKNASEGLSWASLPGGLSKYDREFLLLEASVRGFRVDESNLQIKW